jgi:zinc transport system permease protein
MEIASFFAEFGDIVSYPFMRNALLVSLLASIACGVMGTLTVQNRMTFLAGGASHAAYGGIGLAFYCHLPMLPCTIAFALLASLLMGRIALRGEKNGGQGAPPDAAIGVLWAAGMAFGIILVDLSPGYAGELMGFLFGSILATPWGDIVAMAVFDLVLLLLLALFRQGLWAVSLDREFAKARGLPVHGLFLLLVGLIAITVVMLIRVVGLILVLALLTIPPYLARRAGRTLYSRMVFSSLFALLFCLLGLVLAWKTDISSGAAIIAVATLVYFLVHLPLPHRASREEKP